MIDQNQLSGQAAQKNQVGTYFERGYLTFQDKREIRAGLIAGQWQHIRIEDVKGGNTEVHATKAVRQAA